MATEGFNIEDKNKESKKKLREAFSNFIGDEVRDMILDSSVATVKSIQDDSTCTVEVSDGTELEGIRLQQMQNETGFIITPSVDSIVIITYTDPTTAFISMYSEIDSFMFDAGENGGLIRIEDLTSGINRIVSILNDAITDVNDLKTAVSGWTPVPNDGGAALKTSLTNWSSSVLQEADELNKDDYENTKITH